MVIHTLAYYTAVRTDMKISPRYNIKWKKQVSNIVGRKELLVYNLHLLRDGNFQVR